MYRMISIGKTKLIIFCLCPSWLNSSPWTPSMMQTLALVPSCRMYFPLIKRAPGHRASWKAKKTTTTSQNSWMKRVRLY